MLDSFAPTLHTVKNYFQKSWQEFNFAIAFFFLGSFAGIKFGDFDLIGEMCEI